MAATCMQDQSLIGKKQLLIISVGMTLISLVVSVMYVDTRYHTLLYPPHRRLKNLMKDVLTINHKATAVHSVASVSSTPKQSNGTHSAFANSRPEVGNTKENITVQTEKDNRSRTNLTKFSNFTTLPTHPKKQPPSSATGKNLKTPTTPDPLYTHRRYLSVLDHTKKLNLHCTQCAYVSSSGQLLNTGTGHLIDEADCVFRMNAAPTYGYEEDVGSRTTVRVMAHSSTPNLKSKHKYLIREPSSPSYPRIVIGWGPPKPMKTTGTGYAFNHLKETAKKHKNIDFFYLTQEQMNTADEIFEAETGRPRMKSGTFLSTGWFTMLLARQSCDEIHIYGMVRDDYCQNRTVKNVPYHYYDKRGKKECDYYKAQENGKRSVHRFITEKSIFARWALEQPPMYFHVPDWNP